jgi:tetratricopeptide (TPR) repeat protein
MSTVVTHAALSLDEKFAEGDAERRYARIRRDLGVESFNVNAIRALEAGPLLNEHDETGPGSDRHERVFVVVSGHAVFTVDGEELDAPTGTVVHVPDPEVKRAAVAKEAGTTIIGIGGRPGRPYRATPGEAIGEFWPLYEAKDYEGALAVVEQGLAEFPGNALAHYNVACMKNLLGHPDAALENLRIAVEAWPDYREHARGDDDFTSLRDDARFQELVA